MTDTKPESQPSGESPAEAEQKSRKDGGALLGWIWSSLSSVHLAVVLLLILATISIIGTVLAQGDSANDNVQLFENFVTSIYDRLGIIDADNPASVDAQRGRIQAAAGRLYRFSVRAGFTNLYHAWYFYLLLGLFSLNITICSIKRWPITWRLMKKNKVAIEESRLRAMADRRSLVFDGSLEAAQERVEAALKKGGFSSKSEQDGKVRSTFGQKGTFSRLGVYATHLSILIILIGGIIGVTAGYKGFMQIVEGTSESRFYNRRTKQTDRFTFEVRCDDFHIEYYGNSRRPKDYFSNLTIVDKGVEVLSKRIEVNSPLIYDVSTTSLAKVPFLGFMFQQKIFFYQSSYGDTGQGTKVSLKIRDPQGGAEVVEQFDARRQTAQPFGMQVRVIQVLPNFTLDQNQRPVSKNNTPDNPAALVEVTTPDGQSKRTWLFLNFPDTHMVKDMPLDMVFADYGGVQYTGLQVVYDPGVWVIWLGCTLMVIGLYLAFFISHRRVWVRIEERESGVQVLLAGNANKNREGFSEELQRLEDMISGVERGQKSSE